MTCDELATKVGRTRPYLANIEAGRKPLPPKLLAKVAAALHVPQMAILEPTPDPAVEADEGQVAS